MAEHKGTAVWHGGLKEGKGNITTGSGALNAAYSFGSRFENDNSGTDPEELIGGALSGCFSMFLSSVLEKHGHKPKRIHTEAVVSMDKNDKGPYISKIVLTVEAEVGDIEEADFQNHVKDAKNNCPVSKALAGVNDISVSATLKAS